MAHGQHSGNDTRPANLTTGSNDDFQVLIERLLSLERHQHTTAVVITSAFSLAASLLMIVSIYYDAYSSEKWDFSSTRKKRINPFKIVHPAEVFPLTVAIATSIQATIFIAVQSGALANFWTTGCRITSELIWPTAWLAALVITVFSLEITFRSLRRNRFHPRGKWDTPVYLGIIVVLTIGLWLASFLLPSPDTCPDFLMWWTEHYAKPAIALAGGLILTHIISATVLIVQLIKTVRMERAERIAASRVVYSLAINVVILSFIIPFWVERATFGFGGLTTMIADIVITLSGLLHAVLHVILRGNSDRLAIRARQTPWTKKRKIRLFGPNALSMGTFISTPLLAESSFEKNSQFRFENGLGLTYATPRLQSPQVESAPEIAEASSTSEPQTVAEPQAVARKRSRSRSNYSIFPTRASTRPELPSWAIDNAINEIQAPEPLFSRRHQREMSMQSGETVEIGLRISHAGPEMLSPELLHFPTQTTKAEQSRQEAPSRPERSDSLNLPAATSRNSLGKRVRAKEIAIPKEISLAKPIVISRGLSKGRWHVRDSVLTRHQQQQKRQIMKSLPPIPSSNATRSSVVSLAGSFAELQFAELHPALRSNPRNAIMMSPIRSERVPDPDSPTYTEAASTYAEAPYQSPIYQEPPYRSPTGNEWPLTRKADGWI